MNFNFARIYKYKFVYEVCSKSNKTDSKNIALLNIHANK